jgi:hypothetical protein
MRSLQYERKILNCSQEDHSCIGKLSLLNAQLSADMESAPDVFGLGVVYSHQSYSPGHDKNNTHLWVVTSTLHR